MRDRLIRLLEDLQTAVERKDLYLILKILQTKFTFSDIKNKDLYFILLCKRGHLEMLFANTPYNEKISFEKIRQVVMSL